MKIKTPRITGEWYHCYNRGVDKRRVFSTQVEYERFMALLYACNGSNAISIADRYTHDLSSLLKDKTLERGAPLVDIGAFVLMPNHVHLLLLQLQDGGIARFMQKVFTGYTLFFNQRHERTGSLFGGTYKAKYISDDRYLKQVVPYILLNPAGLSESEWKQGRCSVRRLHRSLSTYKYSSIHEFSGSERVRISGTALRRYYDKLPTTPQMIHNAQRYYLEHSPEV